MVIVKLTGGVGVGRPAVYVNAAQIISFADQTGGCQIRVNSGNVTVVTETADVVAHRIAEALRG